jgi:hypothetical protein
VAQLSIDQIAIQVKTRFENAIKNVFEPFNLPASGAKFFFEQHMYQNGKHMYQLTTKYTTRTSTTDIDNINRLSCQNIVHKNAIHF